MSNYFNRNSQTQYSCVDEDAKYYKGNKANDDGLLFYR